MKKFIRNLIILVLIYLAGNLAYLYSRPYLEQTFGTTDILPYLSSRIERVFNPNKFNQLNNDEPQEKGHTFQKNEATVYVDLKNPTLYNAAIDGLKSWNNTGAFTFKMVNDKKNAQIVIKSMDRSDTDAAGLTNTEYNSLTGYLVHATVQLNSYYLLNPAYSYSNNRIVNTVEHELGHAIGLDHQSGISVMYPQGSFYTIQPSDIENVKKIYHEK
ncbi:matrixin family metalloprotease [Lactobacillus sp. PV034]|uniref:matrixin family metalloprotease n=1 Tax=Lactobacillus sp. PV034 TaxID=2594495 RepID=UPI002240BB87|nr:matrixin family metalloprotease [Lactobacillus sp. PV034]QNQ81298.1 matrixin family metalloprotease [Lactobacillus sp. PV034]